MARAINRLTARQVATLKKPGRHADGAGLYLHIDQNLSKRWVFVFQWRGKRREMGLGGLLDISLADARQRRDAARRLVAHGKNPIEERRRDRAGTVLFRDLAAQVQEGKAPGWSEKHAARWLRDIERHASVIWTMPVSQIETADVVKVLRPIWTTLPETAGRVRGRIEAVLDAATAQGLRTGVNPAQWSENLKHLLADRPRQVKHRPAMPYEKIPAFMAQLRKRDALAARCLEFTILTAARSDEAYGARAEEIADGVWTIPPERMKEGREHRVPLSRQALACLERVGSTKGLLFPGRGKTGKLSNMAMDMLLRRMKQKPYTVHGFRSTFRDWAGDCTNFPREIAEAALSHSVGDAAERAYRRGDALERRRLLMESWANYLDDASEVVPFTRPSRAGISD